MTDTRATNNGKNIVVFSDGTGQEGGVGHNTNVYKLFQMSEDRTKESKKGTLPFSDEITQPV